MNMNIDLFGRLHRMIPRRAALAAVVATAALLGACQTQQQLISRHEDSLSAAGFLVKPANTPERQAMLKKLPPNKFIQRNSGDSVHYVYADPIVCGCLYVGSQQAYNQYKANEQTQRLADEQQMTADTYADASWNWDAWGPWPAGFGFGYRGGRGW
jgi:hypothetical protein